MNFIKNRMLMLSASASVMVLTAADNAEATVASGATVTTSMVGALSLLPQLIKTLAYLAGLTLGLLGVLKIKDHVENPANAPLKDGAIRLAAGGALIATPTLFDVITNLGASSGATNFTSNVGVIDFGTE